MLISFSWFHKCFHFLRTASSFLLYHFLHYLLITNYWFPRTSHAQTRENQAQLSTLLAEIQNISILRREQTPEQKNWAHQEQQPWMPIAYFPIYKNRKIQISPFDRKPHYVLNQTVDGLSASEKTFQKIFLPAPRDWKPENALQMEKCVAYSTKCFTTTSPTPICWNILKSISCSTKWCRCRTTVRNLPRYRQRLCNLGSEDGALKAIQKNLIMFVTFSTRGNFRASGHWRWWEKWWTRSGHANLKEGVLL